MEKHKVGERDFYSSQAAKLKKDLHSSKRIKSKIRDLAQAIEKVGQLRENEIVLDVGCGISVPPTYFKSKIKYFGVDLSREELKLSEMKGSYVNADAEYLPFKDSCFDQVVSFNMLEHSLHPETILEECKRICKPGGRICVSVPNKKANSFRAVFWNIGKKIKGSSIDENNEFDRVHREYSESELSDLFEDVGLRNSKAEYSSFFPSESLIPLFSKHRRLDSLFSSGFVKIVERVFEKTPIIKGYGGTLVLGAEVDK
jgi:ubiquinone/menaquinone biosynthesis C-methylase UbiE